MTRMVPGAMPDGAKKLRYSVSDNFADTDAPVAVNVHGWFAGGGMYARESDQLAETLGWRMVNPSLPGFGGSDSIRARSPIDAFAQAVEHLLTYLEVDDAVILGHSMGGAVAVSFACQFPERCDGLIYRDGAGTPAWRRTMLSRMAQVLGIEMVDLFSGGRTMARDCASDFWANCRSVSGTLPAAAELMRIDQRNCLQGLATWLPMMCVWGSHDQLTPRSSALEFSEHTGAEPVYVAGGHAWMLSKPWLQGELLADTAIGQDFMRTVT